MSPPNEGWDFKCQFLKIEVQFIYNVGFISSVQESESQIHTHTHTFFFRFFSVIGYCKILSIFPYGIQQVLIVYLFYMQWCVYVNPQLVMHLSTSPLSPLVIIGLFSMSMSLFLLCKVICIIILDSAVISYICLCLHPCCCKWRYFILSCD